MHTYAMQISSYIMMYLFPKSKSVESLKDIPQ